MLQGCTPWPEEYVSSYLRHGYWEDISIAEALDRVVDVFPNKEALVFEGRRYTFSQLRDIAETLAAGFLREGLEPLDRVVFQLPNIAEFVLCYYACLKAGIIPVMCLPQHRFTEIEYIANKTEAKGYIIPDKIRKFSYTELADEVKQAVPSLQHVFVVGEQCNSEQVLLQDVMEKNTDKGKNKELLGGYSPDPREVAVFLLSGGTTGLPKIIPRTNNDYLYTAKISSFHMGLNKYTSYLAIAPVGHNMTIACPGIMGTLLRGGKAVLTTSPTDMENFCTIVQQERVTHAGLVPALLITLLNYEERKNYDLSSLVAIVSGGAKLNPEAAKRVHPELDCNLIQQFGMAEGMLIQVDDSTDSQRVILETIGRPISPADEFKIVDDEEKEVPVGEVGEMFCRGPYTIRGYYKAPEHNEQAFTEDGFYKTGDMVKMDPETHCLIVEGRKKDLINRGGEKINAEEIENFILSHPKVKNAAAVAMPDTVLGERCCVYVILKQNEQLTLEELNKFLLDKKIAKFKLPERLEIVEQFPLTNVGKVSKKDLRTDIAEKLEEEKKTG